MFPNTVNLNQAPGIPGDPCSTNPRHSAVNVAGGYVAGPGGVIPGRFVWADAGTNTIVANTGTGAPTGFVMRDQTALITGYLAETGNVIPAGREVGNVMSGGDYWMKNSGASAVTKGMKAFANLTDGSVSYAATGATVSGSIETRWYAWSAGAAGETIKTSTTPTS